jgi:hypothetical protein
MTDIITTQAQVDLAQFEDLTRVEAAARIVTAENGCEAIW